MASAATTWINAHRGDDTVFAGFGDDTITGGAGNDTLNGGIGADTYVYRRGDGHDTIIEVDTQNRIRFDGDITPDDLLLSPGSGVIKIGTDPLDAIEIQGFDPADPLGQRLIEQFEFADGTVLTVGQLIARNLEIVGTDGDDVLTFEGGRISGGAGNDLLFGNVLYGGAGNDELRGSYYSDDVLVGGAGDDTLSGSDGNDIYRFGLGDGHDVIRDGSYSYDDRLVFGAGIAREDVDFLREPSGDLLVRIRASGDSVRLAGWYSSSQTGRSFRKANSWPSKWGP